MNARGSTQDTRPSSDSNKSKILTVQDWRNDPIYDDQRRKHIEFGPNYVIETFISTFSLHSIAQSVKLRF